MECEESQGSGAEDKGVMKFLAKITSELETFTHETIWSISLSPRANKDIGEECLHLSEN